MVVMLSQSENPRILQIHCFDRGHQTPFYTSRLYFLSSLFAISTATSILALCLPLANLAPATCGARTVELAWHLAHFLDRTCTPAICTWAWKRRGPPIYPSHRDHLAPAKQWNFTWIGVCKQLLVFGWKPLLVPIQWDLLLLLYTALVIFGIRQMLLTNRSVEFGWEINIKIVQYQ